MDRFEKKSEAWKNEGRQANEAAEKMLQFKRTLTASELKLRSMAKNGLEKNGSELSVSKNEGKTIGKKMPGFLIPVKAAKSQETIQQILY